MAGGGWSEHWRLVPAGGPPARSRFSVALAIGVDWNETNRPHQVTVSVEDVDGNGVVEATAGFTLGRPPMLSEGSSQLAAVAMTIEVVFPREGEYRVIARVGGQSEAGIDTLTGRVRIVTFRVHDVAGPPQSAAA